MGRYLDYENQKYEKGYKPFELTSENIKANIGKKICYVRSKNVDEHRGFFNVEYGIIHSKRYSQLYIDEGHDSIDIRDVLECGIKIDNQINP